MSCYCAAYHNERIRTTDCRLPLPTCKEGNVRTCLHPQIRPEFYWHGTKFRPRHRHSDLADFSFCVEELDEILSRLWAGAAMYAGADFFVP